MYAVYADESSESASLTFSEYSIAGSVNVWEVDSTGMSSCLIRSILNS